jgi:hypothetical protein
MMAMMQSSMWRGKRKRWKRMTRERFDPYESQ